MRAMNCEFCINENCFVKNCSPEWIAKINTSKSLIRCKIGQNIILEGSPVMGIYFICKGQVKITITGLKNKEQIVRITNDGHILGHRGLGAENYPIGATTLSDSIICFIENEILNEAFRHNPKLTVNLMMYYSHELRKMETRLKYIAQMTTREKVIFALLYLTNTFGLTNENVIDVIISRKEIGQIAGTAGEQVSRELKALKNEGFLIVKGRKITIPDTIQLQKEINDYLPINH